MKAIVQKLINYFLINNKFFQKFIFISYNKINNSKKYFNLDARFVTKEIHLDTNRININKNYKNYFLLLDKNDYKIKSNLKNYKIIFTSFDLDAAEIKNSLFLYCFQQEDLYLKEFENIIQNGGDYESVHLDRNIYRSEFTQTTSYRFVNSNCLKAIKNSLKNLDQISHLFNSTITTHENLCEGLELTKNVPGDFVEVGVYSGGTALTVLNYLKITGQKRNVYLIDTYDGFNYEASKKSSDAAWYKTHLKQKKTKEEIEKNFKNFNNYELIKSEIIKDNFPEKIEKISLAHIDVDMQEATYESLIKIAKKISIHGIIMCEDSAHTPTCYGAKYAMEKFLKEDGNEDKFLKIFKKNHYFLVRIM